MEQTNSAVGNFSKKLVFEKEEAFWIRELSPAIKKHNNTIHKSTKVTPIGACKEVIEKRHPVSNSREKDRNENQKVN